MPADGRLLAFCLRAMLHISLIWSARTALIELLRLSHVKPSLSAIYRSSRRPPNLGIARATGFLLVDDPREEPNTIPAMHLISCIPKLAGVNAL